MKIKCRFLYSGAVLLIAGCMPAYVPLALPSSHPGSTEANEAPMYQSSNTLEKHLDSGSNSDVNQENKTPQSHDMKSTKDMEGMTHASH